METNPSIAKQQVLQAVEQAATRPATAPAPMPSPQPPSAAAQLPAIQQSYIDLERRKRDRELDAEERADIIRQRALWSRVLLWCIVGIVVFDSVVILALGLHLLNFSADYFVPVFIAEGLLKTFGLAYIVVKFLFTRENIGL